MIIPIMVLRTPAANPYKVDPKTNQLYVGLPITPLILTWPMAKRLKLFGITYLVGKIKFKLLAALAQSLAAQGGG